MRAFLNSPRVLTVAQILQQVSGAFLLGAIMGAPAVLVVFRQNF